MLQGEDDSVPKETSGLDQSPNERYGWLLCDPDGSSEGLGMLHQPLHCTSRNLTGHFVSTVSLLDNPRSKGRHFRLGDPFAPLKDLLHGLDAERTKKTLGERRRGVAVLGSAYCRPHTAQAHSITASFIADQRAPAPNANQGTVPGSTDRDGACAGDDKDPVSVPERVQKSYLIIRCNQDTSSDRRFPDSQFYVLPGRGSSRDASETGAQYINWKRGTGLGGEISRLFYDAIGHCPFLARSEQSRPPLRLG